ncbi:MAG: Hpt domain-containing protein, partial [Pseudomonadota bacterium]
MTERKDMASLPVLDREELNHNTMHDRALQEELFDLMFDQTGVYLNQLRDAIAARDVGAWKAGAHGIKGTARSLGLIRLSQTAAHAETSARPSPTVVALLETACSDAKKAAS